MKVLVACEYSGVVRDAFLRAGHDATSCDLLDTDVPGPHYKGDVFDIINDGWDLMIAHPPCTYLSSSGAKHLYMLDRKGRTIWVNGERIDNLERQRLRDEAAIFAEALYEAPIPRVAVENPVGMLASLWRQPNQYVEPWMFGHPETKKTGLWLKKLPPLVPKAGRPFDREAWAVERAAAVVAGEKPALHPDAGADETYAHMMTLPKAERGRIHYMPPGPERWKLRSTTYSGIAAAMADQWGRLAEETAA